jgi:dipeptidyl aminopeptidase/acylaminoacyl peptidase
MDSFRIADYTSRNRSISCPHAASKVFFQRVEETMPAFKSIASLSLLFLVVLPSALGQKPPLTSDEFFNAVDFRSVQISPDGHAVIIETVRPDWAAQRFRNDLWLYRDDGGGSLVQFTQSGHDSTPQWSPDGDWIAFLSDRKKAVGKSKVSGDDDRDQAENDVAQVYVISLHGGEEFVATSDDEEVHAFAWSDDSRRIYVATRNPWTKAEKDAYSEEWKDVIRFRESERGDTVSSVDVSSLRAKNEISTGQRVGVPVQKKLANIPYRVWQMATSPDGRFLAIATDSPSERLESSEPYGIYVADLPSGTLHLTIHVQDRVDEMQWALDSRHVFFVYEAGTPEGPFEEQTQTRLYWVDEAGGKAVRWAPHFTGELGRSLGAFAVLQDGTVFATGQLGTEAQPYTELSADAEFVKQSGRAGFYEEFSAARHSPRVAFVYSSVQRPREVYLTEGPNHLDQPRAITAFNKLFTERELPQGKPYHWQADDGTQVEGMLIYPPGKFEAKHLPTFTWIHGGPKFADGNGLWGPGISDVETLAATQGWLVLQPNYRGSTGYGDAFTRGMVLHVNSRPGQDILEGLDALIKDGIADPDQLTVGGYSSGGDLTNWLITQTTRFKAAVSGAGNVEWVSTWGGDGQSLYGSYLLGGVPWQAEANYHSESAIWQIGKVTTPTLIVKGSEDTTVPVFQSYLLERALQTRDVPHSFLIFPGEGHSFDKNPWHAKIALREELRWIEKYGRKKE